MTDLKKDLQLLLDAIIVKVVPEEYWPLTLRGLTYNELPQPPPVTNIHIQSHAVIMEKAVKYNACAPEAADGCLAYTINWGVMRRRAQRPDWEKDIKSHSIWISDQCLTRLDFDGMAFVLLHEIGHVDQACRAEELYAAWGPDSRELYADYYAYKRLCELYGEEKASAWAAQFGSSHGIRSTKVTHEA